MKIDRIHHVAYRCKDAKETVLWYQKMLNMDFVLAISEDHVPSTKAPDPYMHGGRADRQARQPVTAGLRAGEPLNRCFRDADAADPVVAGLEKLADSGPEGVARRTALAEALKLKNYEFNAQGMELHQRCVSAAVVPDTEAGEEVWKLDPPLYVQATTRPGAKIPHAWLIGPTGRWVSTLDLVGKGKFTLVTGIAGQAWVDAAKALDLPYLRAVQIGTPGAQDVYCNWHAMREIEEAEALLVRPDGVVAWRQSQGVGGGTEQARQALQQALAAVLAQPVAVQPRVAEVA
jgi:2,4-dichlorophenol 6-monooxygenase